MNEQTNEPINEIPASQTEPFSPEDIASAPVSSPDAAAQKSPKAKWGIIAAIAVVILAAAIGLGIYNTPANRLNRQLELGQKYLLEQKYEEAILAFNEAIAIDDRCISAYVGGLEALLNLDDPNATKEFYAKAIDIIDSLDDTFTSENKDDIINLLLQADAVYMPDYETILPIYDRIIEIDDSIFDCIKKYEVLLNEYLDILMEKGDYARIKELAEKYRDLVPGVDFQSYLDRIAEIERIAAENRAFMQKVYDLMKAEDYEAMCEVDGSDEARAFIDRMEGDSYVYIPEDAAAKNGTGSGVYKGDFGYYFYYGPYANGVRNGNGKSFVKQDDGGYELFTGDWSKDAPNGYGELISTYDTFENSGGSYSKVLSGNFVNGLADGDMSKIITTGGINFDLSFNAVNGIPTEDKTQAFYNTHYGNTIPDGHFIYAYDDQGYQYVWSYIGPNETVGIFGFRTDEDE